MAMAGNDEAPKPEKLQHAVIFIWRRLRIAAQETIESSVVGELQGKARALTKCFQGIDDNQITFVDCDGQMAELAVGAHHDAADLGPQAATGDSFEAGDETAKFAGQVAGFVDSRDSEGHRQVRPG